MEEQKFSSRSARSTKSTKSTKTSRRDSKPSIETIQLAWGFIRGANQPNFYLTESKSSIWINGSGKLFQLNDSSFLEDLVHKTTSQKLFTIKQGESGSSSDLVLYIDSKVSKGQLIEVDGTKLRGRKTVRDGTCTIKLPQYDIHLVFEAFCDVSENEKLNYIGEYYKYINLLGKGGFGQVYRGFDIRNEKLCAIKTPFDLEMPHLEREYSLIVSLDHENIIKCLGYINKAYLITELAEGGTLFERTYYGNAITEEMARHIFRQLFAGMEFMHQKEIIHRDLKPENIVLMTADDFCVPKLIDLGVSCKFDDPAAMRRIVGAYKYMSPEILEKKLRRDKDALYTDKVDVWGLGISLFVTLVKSTPYTYSNDLQEYRRRMAHGEMNMSMKNYTRLSPATKDILFRSLAINPNNRASVSELLEFDWAIT